MKKKLKKICLVLMILTLICSIYFNVLSAIRIPNMKAFMKGKEGELLSSLTYNGYWYVETDTYGKETYGFKNSNGYYYVGINGVWLKSVLFSRKILYIKDDTEHYVFWGRLFFDRWAWYVREDFVYPSVSESKVKELYLAKQVLFFPDTEQKKKQLVYSTTDNMTISSITEQVLASHESFSCPESLIELWKIKNGTDPYYYVYVNYDNSPCYQNIATVKNVNDEWTLIPEAEAFESGCPFF